MRLVVAATDDLDEQTVGSLHRLWHEAFRGNFSLEDADHTFGGVHVLMREGRELIAHAAAVPRELLVADRPLSVGYAEAVSVAPAQQGTGVGSRVMTELNRQIRNRYDMGALSTAAHAFYRRLGWERWRGPTYVVDGEGCRHRTEREDDGVMVLRFGASGDVDVTLPIACHDRPGHAW